MAPIETDALPSSNKMLRPHRLSIGRLFFDHFHWKCLITSLLITACLSHVTYCQINSSSDGWRTTTNGAENRTHFHHHYSPSSSSSLPFSSSSPAGNVCANDYMRVISCVLGAVFYVLYLSECWHHFARLGMTPRYSVGQLLELVQTMRTAIPVVWWKSVSYHYVRRTRRVLRYRNGNAVSTTQVYYERVNSNSSGNVFLYDECGYKDLSKRIVDLHKFGAVQMRFSKGFVFACLQAANEFEDQRTRFFSENEMRDDYMEVREGLDLANLPFVERLLVFPDRRRPPNVPKRQCHNAVASEPPNGNDDDHDDNVVTGSSGSINCANAQQQHQLLQLPWWMCAWVYWLLSLILCSWPLRLIAECQTAHVHFQVTKLFGTNYLSPSSVNYTGPLITRTSTMESNELEEATRRNYLIVPSYSEAILLDPMVVDQREPFLQQPANLFRQMFTTNPRRHLTTAPAMAMPTVSNDDDNLTGVHYSYGTIGDDQLQQQQQNHRNFWNGIGTATTTRADSVKRSQSTISFFDASAARPSMNHNNNNNGNHLPPSRTGTAAGGRQQAHLPAPPRSITISEGINTVTSDQCSRPTKLSAKSRYMPTTRNVPRRVQHQQQQQRVGTDREPLLGFINGRRAEQPQNDNQRQQQQQLEMHHFAAFQQMTPPDEPPPPYEFALRYCSPLYQRLRQSAHSLSVALFPPAPPLPPPLSSSSSSRDLQQQQQQYAMDGPTNSSP